MVPATEFTFARDVRIITHKNEVLVTLSDGLWSKKADLLLISSHMTTYSIGLRFVLG
jgi:hypothetical protein